MVLERGWGILAALACRERLLNGSIGFLVFEIWDLQGLKMCTFLASSFGFLDIGLKRKWVYCTRCAWKGKPDPINLSWHTSRTPYPCLLPFLPRHIRRKARRYLVNVREIQTRVVLRELCGHRVRYAVE